LFFAFAGTQVANAGAQTSDNTTTNQSTGFSPIVLMYIAVVFGFSLMVNVWIFFRSVFVFVSSRNTHVDMLTPS